MTNKIEFEAVICIVKSGFSDLVMEAARNAGAKGGTIFNGKGAGNQDAEKFYGLIIHPEKDVILIVVPKDIKDGVLSAIYQEIKGEGIAISLPISKVAGIHEQVSKEEDEEEVKEEIQKDEIKEEVHEPKED